MKLAVRQAGVIPYRLCGGLTQVLLVSRSSGWQWVIPKGHVEPDLTPQQSAVLEAYEEAGVLGVLDPVAACSFGYFKRGTRRLVDVFPMTVAAVLRTWPEMHRRRAWFDVETAADLVCYPGLGQCILLLAEGLRGRAAA